MAGIDRRAEIDTETFKSLVLLNGGGAVALLAFLPAIIDKPEFRELIPVSWIALLLLMLGLVLAIIHNRLRRLCSMEYERHGMRPPPGRLFGFQLDAPRDCWVSTRCMYGSLIAFILAGSTVAITGLIGGIGGAP